MRGRSVATLLVDGGDCYFSTPTTKKPSKADEVRGMRTARKLVKAHNYMGYHAQGLGPADLQFGVDALKELVKDLRHPIVCANLIDKTTGKPVFQPTAIVTIEGTRFGFYGVCLNTLHPTFKKRVLGERYDLLDAYETTLTVVPELRKKCDVLIAISHTDIHVNEQVLETVQGIDLLLDPYSRNGSQPIWITEGEYVVKHNEVPMLRIDGQGSRVGVCHLYFDDGPGRKFNEYDAYDYPLEPHIWGHPEMADLVAGKEPPGWRDRDPHEIHLLDELFLGSEACGACHEAQFEFWKGQGHAKAFAPLVNERKEHLEPACIECHSVGYGLTFVEPEKIGEWKDAGCESCHGIDHRHAENPKRYRLKPVEDSRCWGCHNYTILESKPLQIGQAKRKVACPKMEN